MIDQKTRAMELAELCLRRKRTFGNKIKATSEDLKFEKHTS
jgi:hypothetical protein